MTNPIPTDWKKVKLGDISNVNPKKSELPEKFIYIDLESVNKGKLTKRNKISSINAPSRAQRVLKNNDILFQTVRPYQKNNLFFNFGIGYVASTGYAQIRAKESPMFLYQKLNHQKFVNKVLVRCTGSNYPAINSTDLAKISFLLPPLPEQHRIVAVLETWDKSLEALTKKIQLKKNIKKGLMQQLLTGKKRLPGFSGEWQTVKLGSVCDIKMGQSPSSNSYNEEATGVILIQGNADIKNRKTIRRIWTSEPTRISDKGNIILTVRAPVGVVGIAQDRVCIGRGVCSIEPQKANHRFIFHFLISFEPKWKSFEQGSTFSAVNSSDIKDLKINVPQIIEEQTAIAQVLTTADEEITALEKKKQKLEEQKKFLLNNLITGKIRTPENLTMPK